MEKRENIGWIDCMRVLACFLVVFSHSCDAFVACFDTQSINPNGEGVTSWILNVCKWADEFQKLRAKHNQVETYVPTMLLYTKCRDLEQPQPEIPITQLLLPIKRTYSLWKQNHRGGSCRSAAFRCLGIGRAYKDAYQLPPDRFGYGLCAASFPGHPDARSEPAL